MDLSRNAGPVSAPGVAARNVRSVTGGPRTKIGAKPSQRFSRNKPPVGSPRWKGDLPTTMHRMLRTQGFLTTLSRRECPVCMRILPLDSDQSSCCSCCGKVICCGCDMAHECATLFRNEKKKEQGKSFLEQCCPFCRVVLPTRSQTAVSGTRFSGLWAKSHKNQHKRTQQAAFICCRPVFKMAVTAVPTASASRKGQAWCLQNGLVLDLGLTRRHRFHLPMPASGRFTPSIAPPDFCQLFR